MNNGKNIRNESKMYHRCPSSAVAITDVDVDVEVSILNLAMRKGGGWQAGLWGHGFGYRMNLSLREPGRFAG